MPVVVAWIGEMIASSIGQWILSALLSIGIGFVSSKVATGVIDTSSYMQMLESSGLWNWISYLRLDKDITIIASAWAGRAITDSFKAHLTKLPSKSGGTA